MQDQWRCNACRKLLGVVVDGRLEIRRTGGHRYYTPPPVVCHCGRCRTTNILPAGAQCLTS